MSFNIVYAIMQDSDIIKELFLKDSIHITCIGGGPGSDFLGILKYCLDNRLNPNLRCHIVDKDRTWVESWSDVDDRLGASLRLTINHYNFSVTDDSWKNFKKHLKSELFTLVYFMSEIYSMREKANNYFHSLFASSKPKSIFLFIDNNNDNFYDWFDQFASNYNIKIKDKGEEKKNLPFEEEKLDLGEYFDKFGSPKLTADIAYRIAVKEL